MYRRCQQLVSEGAQHLVSSSGGNAGLAIATVGQRMGLPVTVVIPTSTPGYMKAKLELVGAKVIVRGAVWNEANETAMQLVEDIPSAALVHPFDHPQIWEGHSTIIHEIQEQLAEQSSEPLAPAAVITVVGGSGLLGGVMRGCDQVVTSQTSIYAHVI